MIIKCWRGLLWYNITVNQLRRIYKLLLDYQWCSSIKKVVILNINPLDYDSMESLNSILTNNDDHILPYNRLNIEEKFKIGFLATFLPVKYVQTNWNVENNTLGHAGPK